jgi:hypothetical protein
MDEIVHSTKLTPKALGAAPRESFRPLMHSLLSFGLVKRVDDGGGLHHWELTAEAEARLDEVSASVDRPITTLAYLDHLCARCRQQKLTHLLDGRFVCLDCERAEQEQQTQSEPSVGVQRRWERSLRPRKSP